MLDAFKSLRSASWHVLGEVMNLHNNTQLITRIRLQVIEIGSGGVLSGTCILACVFDFLICPRKQISQVARRVTTLYNVQFDEPLEF